MHSITKTLPSPAAIRMFSSPSTTPTTTCRTPCYKGADQQGEDLNFKQADQLAKDGIRLEQITFELEMRLRKGQKTNKRRAVQLLAIGTTCLGQQLVGEFGDNPKTGSSGRLHQLTKRVECESAKFCTDL